MAIKFGYPSLENKRRLIPFGEQWLFKFKNNYGASVVRNEMSYGHQQGLFELAVISWLKDDWILCYTTKITNDVIGFLSEDEVEKLLIEIESL